jgi:hypothetical protein
MEALSSTEYITDLSEGRSNQPNQRVAKAPASYFGDSGFKLRWANPELSLFFLDPSSHVPKYYFKSCYNRFLSYPCQLFTHKSYYHSLRAELLRCSSIPVRGRKFFSSAKHSGYLRDSVSLSCYECWRVLPREKSGLGVRQTFPLHLTLKLLTWRIWWAPNNASKCQMEFNLAFKGLMSSFTMSGTISTFSGVGGLEVACWPLVPKFASSHPTEAVGFLERKNPQHAFLRRGTKAVGPMS